MSEQKHFRYEGSFTVKSPEVSVLDVKFLIPITVKYKVGEEEKTALGQIDYANREIYFPDTLAKDLQSKLKEKTLIHLNQATHMDPGSFAAPEELVLKAESMRAEYEKEIDSNLGEEDE